MFVIPAASGLTLADPTDASVGVAIVRLLIGMPCGAVCLVVVAVPGTALGRAVLLVGLVVAQEEVVGPPAGWVVAVVEDPHTDRNFPAVPPGPHQAMNSSPALTDLAVALPIPLTEEHKTLVPQKRSPHNT
jgi:hypothetical protein